ncbi:MAG: peptidylglycine alpha-amidating monooxygenase [Labilithrix sp.]|nr:peptidylglycine alpha-amidating monooxygenase [Labilithrix sp.]MCW5816932.1 peptidylglycine alpha-amidating monooxygenase [Labilithrix sp.]
MNLVRTVVVLLALAGCGDGAALEATERDRAKGPDGGAEPIGTTPDGEPIVTTKTGLPCDVDAVLKPCQTCHGAQPAYGAGVPLVTWDDLQRPGPGGAGKVLDLVGQRIADDARPMPPSPNPRLTAEARATYDGWVKAGAPASDATCTGKAPEAGVKALSCTPDTVLTAKKDFVMEPGSALDQYVCFGVDVNLAKKRHITALAPKVDNAKIVHHILLFQSNTAVSGDPFPCEAFGSAAWKLVAGWAPGGDNLELPKEAGFPEEAGATHWVIQMHYNNATAKTGTDRSGYELCTTEDLRPNDAGVMALGSISFAIPPRSETTIRCDYAVDHRLNGATFFNASPHMHTRGASMTTERLPNLGRGTPEPVFEQKAFSFEAQANFPIDKKVQLGDVLRTRCGWKNPSDLTLGFGEGTNDEMCFNFIGYYPAVKELSIGVPFTWVTPATLSLCTPE